ncbi:hypothetical protein ES704_03352 [subsurface metagenome]|jgi:MFS superfamily sulfate permease-like transporter
MKSENRFDKWPDFRFNLEEIAGAIGDYGTLFPIVLGVAIVSNLNLGYILLFFSAWYIITGLYYKMPMPVEPMKVIGAIVIAGGLNKEEITASGMILGIFFLILGFCKCMKFIQEKVPSSVVRGIQMGLALILFKTSTNFIVKDSVISVICITIIILFYIANKFTHLTDISVIVVLLIGIVIGLLKYGIPQIRILPLPTLIVPGIQDFVKGGWLLAISQAPLTITNAILSTSLLMQDLIHREVEPDKLSISIGLMNLTSVPFGGFPMCHGAGGLAAQYRFGARTGGSNIISGLILLPIALFFASPEFVAIIPLGVFGALLVFVAIELGKHSFKTNSYIVTITIAILALIANMTIAFIVGIILAYSLAKITKRHLG